MKKVLVTILAIVYLGTSIGATINMHYCMDKLVAWGFGKEKTGKKSCPYCGMAKTTEDKHCGKQSKACCKDEQRQIKIEKDQKVSESAFQSLTISSEAIVVIHTDLTVIYPSSVVTDNPFAHAPPRSGAVPIFVLNRNFRI